MVRDSSRRRYVGPTQTPSLVDDLRIEVDEISAENAKLRAALEMRTRRSLAGATRARPARTDRGERTWRLCAGVALLT